VRCYFDNHRQLNINSVKQINSIRSFDDFELRYCHPNLSFTYSTTYDSQGIYFVEVSTHAHLWCSSNHHSNSFNLIESIPHHVIDAAKLKKIRIVIIAVVEGDSYENNGVDAYEELTASMWKIGLPQYSVLIISGNLNANAQYLEWCNKNEEFPWIEFSEGIDWTGQRNWPKQIDPIFSKSLTTAKFLYNSLNRAHRSHRSEHLYFLAHNNLLTNGLVSGGIWFNDMPGYDKQSDPILPPEYIEAHVDNYRSVLREHYPRTVDSNSTSLRDNHFAGISNLNIFKDSLLTVSTESHFDDNRGLFITEKTFRPIAMGHPFIVLGQPNLLKKLQSFGFKTDFIDTSYDEILDNKKRFAAFHESFLNWINDDKEKYFAKWQLYVEHNLYIYQHTNFRKLYIGDAVERTTRYFKELS
jgi:hypothetical protein